MVCLSFPPMSAPRLVTQRSSIKPTPPFRAALLYLSFMNISVGLLQLQRSWQRFPTRRAPRPGWWLRRSTFSLHHLTRHLQFHRTFFCIDANERWRGLPNECEGFSSWLVPEAEHQDATQLLNSSSWEVARPGGTALTSQGSCGRCLRGGPRRSAGSMHVCAMVGLGTGNQWFLSITIMKCIWKRSFFSRSLLPGADNSLEMQSALPGLAARCKGKHALLRGVAGKARSCPVAPRPWRSS